MLKSLQKPLRMHTDCAHLIRQIEVWACKRLYVPIEQHPHQGTIGGKDAAAIHPTRWIDAGRERERGRAVKGIRCIAPAGGQLPSRLVVSMMSGKHPEGRRDWGSHRPIVRIP